jgi:hypothetical protein
MEAAMIVYAHAYDMFDAGTTWSRHSRASEVAQVVLQQRDTVATLVQRVRTAARSERSIYTLIINAHGEIDAAGRSIGSVSLSDITSLDAGTALQMAPLAPYFSAPCNGVELHSCEVLASPLGWNLCRVLARELRVNVYASNAPQRGVSPWYSSTPADERGRFEGVVMRFAPDGTYSNAVPELRARDLISAS